MPISTKEYEKALSSLKEVIELSKKFQSSEPEKKVFRDAKIQRFEFCVELAWKTARKILGSSSTAPKIIVREMAQNALITDPSKWLTFIDARNESSHTYDEEKAIKVEKVVHEFLPEGENLLVELKKK